jgi:hypothetical protein
MHSRPGTNAGAIRLTFGDGPDLSAAERVAEIADAKVSADGRPLKVERLPDGLEAGPLQAQPAVPSAFADRGYHDSRQSIITVTAERTAPAGKYAYSIGPRAS